MRKENTKRLFFGLAIGLAVFLSGCASIMHGTGQDIGISSSPSGATVTVNGNELGRTPLTAELKRKDNHIIKIDLDGYLPHESTFTRSVSGWVWGNIAFGGLIGLAVDAISGGLYKLSPEQMHAELRREGVAHMYRDDRLYLAVVLEVDPNWEKVGQLQASN